MANYIIPGAAALSEFVGLPVHQYGDCGPDATLMALHAIAPARWPLTPAGLYQLDMAEEHAGYAASNGAQNIPEMSNYLAKLGVPHRTYGYGTADLLEKLHAQLKLFLAGGSHDPVIVEYDAAGAGFPDDEAGVHRHFNVFAGENDDTPSPGGYVGGYWRGDGDSRTDSSSGGVTHLVLTPWQEIERAEPIAFIVVHALASVDHIVHGPSLVL